LALRATGTTTTTWPWSGAERTSRSIGSAPAVVLPGIRFTDAETPTADQSCATLPSVGELVGSRRSKVPDMIFFRVGAVATRLLPFALEIAAGRARRRPTAKLGVVPATRRGTTYGRNPSPWARSATQAGAWRVAAPRPYSEGQKAR
jgi:hypothetical protein